MKMQKRKNKRKKINKKNNHGLRNLIILIVTAIALSTLIYYLSTPGKRSQTRDNKTISKHEQKSKKLKKSKPVEITERESIKVIQQNQPTKSVNGTAIKQEDQIKKVIYHAAGKMDVPEKKIRSKEKSDGIYISIPLDRELVDLTFANMIIKGDVMSVGGAFISGKEDTKHNTQILTFKNRLTDKKYVVELFYEKTLISAPKRKQLGIIVDDFGNYSGQLLQDFVRTNPSVTFAIMPNTKYGKEALTDAKANGHECIIHIPMEPLDYPQSNPGTNAIYVQLSQKEIEKRMEDYIHQLPGCVGANNHMGSFASSDVTAMQAVMRVLRRNNLYFVDSRTTSESVAFNMAQKGLVPAYRRDLFIDEPNLSEDNLRKQLALLQNLRSSQDYAIVIMHCHTRAHLDYLNRFIRSVPALGYDIVPISKIQSHRLPTIL
jgi:uncharacterized protein